jgi:hypothetical protein
LESKFFAINSDTIKKITPPKIIKKCCTPNVETMGIVSIGEKN